MALPINLEQMTYSELTALITTAQDLRNAQKTKILNAYSKNFVKLIGQGKITLGLSILSNIPIVEPKDIGLTDNLKTLVTPASMGNHSAVRGILLGRHFIAIKLRVTSPLSIDEEEEKGVCGDFIEVQRVWDAVVTIFQKDNNEDNKSCYITPANCLTSDGSTIPSVLSKKGQVMQEKIKAVGLLLQGNEVEAPSSDKDKRLVKMV